MKRFSTIIKESFNTYRFYDLEVTYDCIAKNGYDYMIFWVPETYSEDDFLIYLQDMFSNELPASESNANDFFGANGDNIYDVYFKYDTYEKNSVKKRNNSEPFFDWDSNLDTAHNENNEDFTYVKIKGLKYVIKFDEFDIKDSSELKTKETLIKIFQNAENNNSILKLKLDKNIIYKE